MKIITDLSKGSLVIRDALFPVSCHVRSYSGGSRASHEVVRSIPGNFPYDPKPFPKGLWEITGIEWQKDKGFDLQTYGPVKIRTNAWQSVNIWELDNDGDYKTETSRQARDEGYLLHYSNSRTTLGCIRLASPKDAEEIAGIVQRVLNNGEQVLLEVSGGAYE